MNIVKFFVVSVALALFSTFFTSSAEAQLWVKVGQIGNASIYRDTSTGLEWTQTLGRVNNNASARQLVNQYGFNLPTFQQLSYVANMRNGIAQLNMSQGLLDFYETSNPNVVAGPYGGNITTPLARGIFQQGPNFVIGVR